MGQPSPFRIVRNNTRGRKTTHLNYEAYEPMALRKMREIGEAVRQRWQIGQVGMVHRLGRLEIGEVSVAIVITSPHRGSPSSPAGTPSTG